MIFHLVSRLHRREPWFVPDLRGEVASLIRRMIGRTDARLLAYAVMPNHLHVALRQGQTELGDVMQPLLRRVAHRVQVRHGFQGTVVERRYRDRLCRTADHARETVMYIHLNPWRAGLCDDDLAYPWMTQDAYLSGADPVSFGIDPHVQLSVLELFALGEERTREGLCRDYLRWLRWRMSHGRGSTSGFADLDGLPPPPPESLLATRAWRRHFAGCVQRQGNGPVRTRPDLRDYVMAQLPRLAPGYQLSDLRGSWLPRPAVRCRKRLIRAAAGRGYRTGKIARLLDISPTTVSLAKHGPADAVE